MVSPPFISFFKMDAGKIEPFQIELYRLGAVLFSRRPGFGRGGEIVGKELVIPYGVLTMQADGGVLQPDILKLGLLFEEPPVGDVYLKGAGIKNGILVLVLYQGAFQRHFVEKGEIDAFDPDSSM